MLRFIAALIASALLVAAVVFGAVLSQFLSKPVTDGLSVVAMLAFPVLAFVYTYHRLGGEKARRRAIESEIGMRKEQAVDRELPQRARRIADGLGDSGVWQSATMRIIGGAEPRIDVAANGGWSTVFAARFHPKKEGQVVPYQITKKRFATRWDREHLDPHVVSTRTVGAEDAYWEVLSYVPGAWESELGPLLEAADAAALKREQDRFGV